MGNKEAKEVIDEALARSCVRDGCYEWDNCRHQEASAWFDTLLAQIARKNDAL